MVTQNHFVIPAMVLINSDFRECHCNRSRLYYDARVVVSLRISCTTIKNPQNQGFLLPLMIWRGLVLLRPPFGPPLGQVLHGQVFRDSDGVLSIHLSPHLLFPGFFYFSNLPLPGKFPGIPVHLSRAPFRFRGLFFRQILSDWQDMGQGGRELKSLAIALLWQLLLGS